MVHGWAGNNLEIDLSQGTIQRSEGDPGLNRDYLGGRGIGTKIAWDRISPEIAPLSPENLLIFGSGVLTGTTAPGANRTSLVTRSLQTNLLTYSTMGGYWGAELKHAGYDTVVVGGKSSRPVYIWINDDQVEIRDATHLWGLDTVETQKRIRKELNNNRVRTLCIGPAGENLVTVASIEHSTGASFSRAGVGAVMGKKKLKAIVVYGTKDLNIAEPAKMVALSEKILRRSAKLRVYMDDRSHNSIQGFVGFAAYGNLGETRPWPTVGDVHKEYLRQYQTRRPSCCNCQVSCKSSMRLPAGGYAFLKCQSWCSFLLACKIQDFAFNARCYHLCELYGLDSVSTGNIIGFAIDIYEKGILTKADTGGIHLEYGNAELAFSLVEKITRREGFGDLLSKGVYEASRLIGKGAEEHAYTVKKMEILPWNLWMPYYAFCTAVNEKGDMTRMAAAIPQGYFHKPLEERKELIEEGFWPYPEEFQKYLWEDLDWSAADVERNVKMISYDWDKNALADCTGLCIFWTGLAPYLPIQVSDHADLVAYATGMDFEQEAAILLAQRVNLLFRVYNVLLGIRRKDDRIHEKWFKEPREEERYYRGEPNPPEMALGHEQLDKWIDEYYKLRGWNAEGIPTLKEIERLGLGFVTEALQRKIGQD